MSITFILLSAACLVFIALTVGVSLKIILSQSSNILIIFSPFIVILYLLFLPALLTWILIFKAGVIEQKLQNIFVEKGVEPVPVVKIRLKHRIRLLIGLCGLMVKWFPEFLDVVTSSLSKTRLTKTEKSSYLFTFIFNLLKMLPSERIQDIRSRFV
ncbi:hypothetical protein [Paenibacillus xylanexedens]|uniref:hypothetical protein n=1 Tax=Paenibacillus xylanexedens TaxID=528191 RepID=UPI000F52634A|nr:hypothetical protein [Paenibacillus xylanexedens]